MNHFLLILFTALALSVNVFNAKVVGVIDGDTVIVLTSDNEQIRVRLEGIDCPESDQDFGQRAKQAASDLCFKKNVRIEQSGTDRYGRMLAFVYVGEVCVNEELIKQGMAWHFKKYNQDPGLAKLEVEARKAKVGLWGQGNPVAPWEWRKLNK